MLAFVNEGLKLPLRNSFHLFIDATSADGSDNSTERFWAKGCLCHILLGQSVHLLITTDILVPRNPSKNYSVLGLEMMNVTREVFCSWMSLLILKSLQKNTLLYNVFLLVHQHFQLKFQLSFSLYLLISFTTNNSGFFLF